MFEGICLKQRILANFYAGTFLCLLFMTHKASGMIVQASSDIGLMQQPTSQYYHLVYGGYVQLGLDSQKAFARISYCERPKFDFAGFSDQEQAGFIQIGSSLHTYWSFLDLNALFGAGRLSGYIKANDSQKKEDFILDGISLEAEAVASLAMIRIGLSHRLFTGIKTREELESYVGWPYRFFSLTLGIAL